MRLKLERIFIGKVVNQKYWFLCLFFLLIFVSVNAQKTVDLENLPNPTKITLNGSVGASSIFYDSNLRSARLPYTYVLQGNLTGNWLSFSMPISYVLTNQGDEFSSQIPYRFDRLSLNPKYKWISAYVGDAALSFSPYSYNGHQFTGLGAELTPTDKPYKVKFFGGQLLRAVEDDGQDFTQPTYQRMGYGLDFLFEKEKFSFGFNSFYAKDNDSSINQTRRMDSLLISPGENFVLGFTASRKITERLVVKGQYANSFLTNDTRIESGDAQSSLAGLFIKGNGSSQNKHAYNMALDYKFDRMDVGFAYERIAPGYETFGAYFFNNDFENITFNASRNFFDDALQIKTNFGLQRDDLNDQKLNSTIRNIGAIDGTLALGRLNLSGGYSNFTTFTNAKLNQIEQQTDQALQNVIDSTDYRQLSQNAFFNADYILAEKDNYTQNVNFGYNLSSSANEQDGLIFPGQANNFHNFNTGFTQSYSETGFSINPSFNFVYSDLGFEDSQSWGLNLTVSKPFLNKKLNSSFTATHNNSENSGITSQQTILQMSSTLVVLEKHNFSLNATQLISQADAQENLQEFTLNFGYNYNFGLLQGKENQEKTNQTKETKQTRATPQPKKHKIEFLGKEIFVDAAEVENEVKRIVEENLASKPADAFATRIKTAHENFEVLSKNYKKEGEPSRGSAKKNYLDALAQLEKEIQANQEFERELQRLSEENLARIEKESVAMGQNLKNQITQETIERARKTKKIEEIPYIEGRLDFKSYNNGNTTKTTEELKQHYFLLDRLSEIAGKYTFLQMALQRSGLSKEYKDRMAKIYLDNPNKLDRENQSAVLLVEMIFKILPPAQSIIIK